MQGQLGAGAERRRSARRGRYAPSPTGLQHRGNLRTALLSWLVTRLQDGEWLLRLDDLDTPRNRPGAEAAILADLHWLGLAWDGPPIRQSERTGLYATVLSSFRRGGVLYPCRCSRRTLADVSAPHGASPVYPGHCRARPPQPGPAQWGVQQGRLPSWRLALGPGPLGWPERLAAAGQLDGPSQVGDVVLRRSDGFLAYHLATAVDELTLGIADVVRGEDLWASTGAQVAVMELLGQSPPDYWHVPLWRDAGGERLAKRSGSEGLEGLRAQGLDGPGVIGLMAASLELVPAGARLSADELLAELRRRGGLAALERLLGERGQAPAG
ncbi:tRNA glutamyl-Q(34) synthetase GluQRS [Synechococcus sp. GreenBA-s]|nr:tRNA glutamyl-Q(34) synthetase GluQRS [Synechococcus sp. GreenBA-s]